MKKIIISVLICIVLVFAGTSALAEEADSITSGMQDGNRERTIEDLFDTYNPTGKQTFLDLKAEHQAFHENRGETRTEVIQFYAGQMSVISGQVADGTLTPAEGSEQLKAVRAEITELRADIQSIREQKQVEADAIKAQLTALRDSVKEALQQDDVIASEIAAYLEQFNQLLADHIEMDYKYAEMVDNLLPAY